jgi:hypothetical protein
MSCNFSLFLFFIPSYIFLIYNVFFNKVLSDLNKNVGIFSRGKENQIQSNQANEIIQMLSSLSFSQVFLA